MTSEEVQRACVPGSLWYWKSSPDDCYVVIDMPCLLRTTDNGEGEEIWRIPMKHSLSGEVFDTYETTWKAFSTVVLKKPAVNPCAECDGEAPYNDYLCEGCRS